jgi:CRP/FNR family transcriptional regulator, nitrogen oxide reductase regulator
MGQNKERAAQLLNGFGQTALFKGLSLEERKSILDAGHERVVEDDAYFFYQGDPAENIYILVEGRVKLTQVTVEGQQILLRVIGPWMLFGGIVIAMGETYPVSAQSVEKSIAMVWTKQSLMVFMNRVPALAMNTIQIMAGQVKEFQDRFRELATERVERRLARSILRLTSQTGKKVPEGVLLDMPLTRQDLAEMTGTTLFTVSRILTQWEEQGLIQSGREKIIVRFPHGLVSIAEDLPGRLT